MMLTRKPRVGEVLTDQSTGKRWVVKGFRERFPEICYTAPEGNSDIAPQDWNQFIWSFRDGLNKNMCNESSRD